MVSSPGRTLRFALFSAMLWMVGAVCASADLGDPFGSGTANSGGPLQLALTTDKGCGPQATYKNGDPITFFFRAGKSATLNLINVKPDGSVKQLVTNLQANAGWTYRIDSFVGTPLGTRTLKFYAQSGNVTDQVECSFTVNDNGLPPIVVHLSTDRGCGDPAVYQRGEPLMVTFSVEEDATVRVVNQRPDGDVVLTENFQAQANVPYPLNGNAGQLLGSRTLKLDATAGSRSGQAVCSFKVVDAIPQNPIIAQFQTNKGCGSDVTFQDGDPISFLFQVNEAAWIRLTNTLPNGTEVLLDNFVVQPNNLYHLDRMVGQPAGGRTLKLEAHTATRTETAQCDYQVVSQPLDNSIVITATTGRGSGPDAVYRTDESMGIVFRLSDDATIRVRIVKPNSTQELINNYQVGANKPYTFIFDVGEPAGPRTIVIDARNGTHGGHFEIPFTVVH